MQKPVLKPATRRFFSLFCGGAAVIALSMAASPAAQAAGKNAGVYTGPTEVRDVAPAQVISPMDSGDSQMTNTPVSAKISEIESQLADIQSSLSGQSSQLSALEQRNRGQAATYYANVATINTQLQSGTTPGNPRLVSKLKEAESSLEDLASNITQLNELSVQTSTLASEASYLLETARSTYGLSGAVEEDHVRLARVEDSINGTIVLIERLMNNVTDDVTRTTAYMGSERNNLRTLALAVSQGALYGKSLANRPFSRVGEYGYSNSVQQANYAPAPDGGADQAAPQLNTNQPRPLVKIRFDKPDVKYEQPLYLAINEALDRYPNAQFDLVAVHPANGNPAQVAIESTKARRNAEKVLRSLTQMGLPMERVNLSYMESPDAPTNEVHIYLR